MSAILGGSVGNIAVPETAPRGPQAGENSYRWATVTAVSPLTIRLDGEDIPLPMVPESLVDPSRLSVSQRVWVQLFGRRVLILGASQGGAVLTPVSGAAGDWTVGGHLVGTGIPWAMAAGSFGMTPAAAPGGMTADVTFPTGRFTQAPIVVLGPVSNGYLAASAGASDTSGFNARMWSLAGTPIAASMRWVAVQMTSSTAGG
jgi:hypothetical protein